MTTPQFLTQRTENGVTVLVFTQPLLGADAVMAARAAIYATENRQVILDCQSVRFLVSGSLYPDQDPFKPLLKLRQELSDAGGRLVLCNLAPDFAEVLRVTRLDQVFEIQPDVVSALR